jgi:nucleoside-diphosphate-sugar epimerase
MAAATRAASEADFARVNEQGTRVLAEAIRLSNQPARRLVYLSSLAAAGPARNGRPVTAHDEPAPLTAYGRTKLAGERVCRMLDDLCQVIVLRPPAVYGPRERDLLEFFRLARRGILPVPAGPHRPLQMVHATDLARAILLAATADRAAGVYHIAEPSAYTWEEICRMLAGAVAQRARLVKVPAAFITGAAVVSEVWGKLMRQPSIFSRDKARELLAPGWLCETEAAWRDIGFRTEIPLERGLSETANWYRAHGWL